MTSVAVTNDPANVYSETAVAFNPGNSSQLVAGSNITTQDEMAGFTSANSGATWGAQPVTPPSGVAFATDPGIAFDSAHVFYSYVGVDPSLNPTLYLSQSAQSPVAWSVGNPLTSPTVELPDKPLLTVDNTTGKTSSHTNNIYVGYDSFLTTSPNANPLYVQRGTASTAFSESRVWDSGGEIGADPVVDPSTGDVYVAWLDYCGLSPATVDQPCLSGSFTGQILLSRSTDGGATWSPTPTEIAPVTTGSGSVLPNYGATCASGCASRPVTSFPSIAVDSTGTVYAVWSDGADAQLGTSTVPSSHRMHIYFSKSSNGGTTWTMPAALDTGNPNDAWEPSLSVDPSNGNLTVAWYDRRDDVNNHLYRPYYTQSTSGGSSWSTPVPLASNLSDPTIDCNGTGDYMQVASVGGHAHIVWTDMSGGVPQVWASDVNEAGTLTPTSGNTVSSPLRDPNGTQWTQMPGSAQDIGVGSDSFCTPAVIGTDNFPGGGGVYVWATKWIGPIAGGSGKAITVDAFGLPDIVNGSGGIYALTLPNGQPTWQQLPGNARDIGAGADGSLWVIGTNPVPGGYGIYDFDFNSGNWVSPGGGGVRLAIGPDGEPWIVNSAGQIYCHNGSGWQQLPGAARDIGVGADGVAWVVGTNPVPGGYGVYRWSAPELPGGACNVGGGWVNVGGGAMSVSVGVDGLPFVINNAGGIYERNF